MIYTIIRCRIIKTLSPEKFLNQHLFQNDIVLVHRYTDPVTQVPKSCPVGTVICLRRPRNPNHLLIKRLVGLEGNFYGREIPQGFCWVASDAGKGYLDSSVFGLVPLTDVLGDVKFVVFPPHRIGRLPVKTNVHSLDFSAWRRVQISALL